MKYKIGQLMIDEDGTVGVVSIFYSDGDIVTHENDAAHPNPKPIESILDRIEKKP